VRTSKGDFVLDNLRDDVRSWEQTGYRFLKRQASNHTGRWVSIRDDQQVLVGSVR
jgi:predicted transglutaminase-like cysteine proteinase